MDITIYAYHFIESNKFSSDPLSLSETLTIHITLLREMSFVVILRNKLRYDQCMYRCKTNY